MFVNEMIERHVGWWYVVCNVFKNTVNVKNLRLLGNYC